jgi:uncharacterized cupredoxin-like copper-binding protein
MSSQYPQTSFQEERIVSHIVHKVKHLGLVALLVGVMGMALSACGEEAPTATPAPPATPTTAPSSGISTTNTATGEQEVNITLKEWSIDPTNIKVKAGKVKFIVTNQGQFDHDISFDIPALGDAAKLKPFPASASPKTLELDLTPGTYTMICDVPGHADHGMKGTLFVVK